MSTTVEPKKKHTVRNVLLILTGIGVLMFGGCTALVVGAASSVDTAIKESDKADAAEVEDVTDPKIIQDRYLDEAEVTVTNSSSKTSDYSIEVSAENASGSKQYATTFMYIENVKPGQTRTDSTMLDEQVPDDAVITVVDVDRSESL